MNWSHQLPVASNNKSTRHNLRVNLLVSNRKEWPVSCPPAPACSHLLALCKMSSRPRAPAKTTKTQQRPKIKAKGPAQKGKKPTTKPRTSRPAPKRRRSLVDEEDLSEEDNTPFEEVRVEEEGMARDDTQNMRDRPLTRPCYLHVFLISRCFFPILNHT